MDVVILPFVMGALIIGADCPDITAQLLDEAVLALRTHELVLGPAHDGGYYLIGLRRSIPAHALQRLFADIPLGSATVLNETLNRANETALTTTQLRTLHDIDRPEDLKRCEDSPAGSAN